MAFNRTIKEEERLVSPNTVSLVDFELKNPGPVEVELVNGRSDYRLELLPQYSIEPVRRVEGKSPLSITPFEFPGSDAPEGWWAKVTNIGSHAENILVRVIFPGSTRIVEFKTIQKRVPISTIQRSLNELLGGLEIRLDDGVDASAISHPNTGTRIPFTIEALQVKLLPVPRWYRPIVEPLIGGITTVTLRANDINSSRVRVGLAAPSGRKTGLVLTFSFDFESNGQELTGTLAAEVTGMRLDITLPLVFEKEELTYDSGRLEVGFQFASFSFSSFNWLIKKLVPADRLLRERVTSTVRSRLTDTQTVITLTSILTAIAPIVFGVKFGLETVDSVQLTGSEIVFTITRPVP